MQNKSEMKRKIDSCRVGRIVHTRIMRSSHIPKDFFSSGHQSSKSLTKIRCS